MKKNCQNLDRLIRGINSILLNRCSLSEEETSILMECIFELEKQKSRSETINFNAILKVIELLLKFFNFNDFNDVIK